MIDFMNIIPSASATMMNYQNTSSIEW